MTHADIAFGLILAALSAYLLFGGADLGAGLWHLLSRDRPGDRRVIERATGPFRGADHAWLAAGLLMAWAAFPSILADLLAAYRVPLALAAAGLVARATVQGLTRASSGPPRLEPLLGPVSQLTPFCLGAVAAAVSTGAPSWMSVSGVYGGALTTMLCAYLAAVRLIWDARRFGEDQDVPLHFQGYAVVSGVATGLFALPGAVVFGVRSPLILVSAAAGLLSLVLVLRRRHLAVRLTSALAVVSVLWGGASMADLDLAGSVARNGALDAAFAVLAVGAVVLVPAVAWLYVRRGSRGHSYGHGRAHGMAHRARRA
ncbi:cytochrome d ubiquinol oxidase subunit II [Actinomadura logoneensis]|uniref:Cytochrome d ubiquinol oxidase subunit II n=1 Tax=Actinomadura logoneensis TaxID=2293572 RepID=A0A372JRX4_9ACTN|nr:cytochrome d ubiquinol oxidase subunit II [Actinomadura logoneensis]RFU42514.1 cytochrome d ubiquinol oxidase subunit II [Actinomadura logoneensis]